MNTPRNRQQLLESLDRMLTAGLPAAQAAATLSSSAGALVSLHALLDAGVPALDALAGMRDDYSQMDEAHREVRDGASLASALRDADLIDTQHGYPRVDAGEQAGRLVDALGRHISEADEQQESREGLLAEWFPRLIYGAAAGFAAWSMIGGSLGR